MSDYYKIIDQIYEELRSMNVVPKIWNYYETEDELKAEQITHHVRSYSNGVAEILKMIEDPEIKNAVNFKLRYCFELALKAQMYSKIAEEQSS